MDYQVLADLLFPNVTKTREELEAEYPARSLPEGAKVTRFAPSPTGFVHFGGLFPATVGERLAHQSGGVFYLRIEDTDAKREVPGAAAALVKTLANYGVKFDEGMTLDGEKGDYGQRNDFNDIISDRGKIGIGTFRFQHYHIRGEKFIFDFECRALLTAAGQNKQ